MNVLNVFLDMWFELYAIGSMIPTYLILSYKRRHNTYDVEPGKPDGTTFITLMGFFMLPLLLIGILNDFLFKKAP